jgi:hypothetical protein
VIHDHIAQKQPVYLLDVGAGKGRLATFLSSQMRANLAGLRYIPVEPDEASHEDIKEAGKDFPAEVIKDVEQLPTTYDGKVTVAVLCNVLHEIRPTRWLHLLSLILDKLAQAGSLVICEDQLLPTGERPHEVGFLILNRTELQTLFTLPELPRQREHPNERYRGRLLCVEIPKAKAKVTRDSVTCAVENLRRRLLGVVRDMRSDTKPETARDGRLYSFYSQMLINCNFALEEL